VECQQLLPQLAAGGPRAPAEGLEGLEPVQPSGPFPGALGLDRGLRLAIASCEDAERAPEGRQLLHVEGTQPRRSEHRLESMQAPVGGVLVEHVVEGTLLQGALEGRHLEDEDPVLGEQGPHRLPEVREVREQVQGVVAHEDARSAALARQLSSDARREEGAARLQALSIGLGRRPRRRIHAEHPGPARRERRELHAVVARELHHELVLELHPLRDLSRGGREVLHEARVRGGVVRIVLSVGVLRDVEGNLRERAGAAHGEGQRVRRVLTGEALVRDEAVRQGHEPEVQHGLELGRPAAAAGRARAHSFLQTFQGAWSRALRSFRWT